ncbi:hypothetical protein M885DRAFT_617605 [Pelagophyceae sp. CCMP2097]|nr:hypothetical protein M885DRAFT_617605 [Pelagophyceae sp. CCMP2097]|mmetsp:Transcript_14171/g.47299  ORF Transcript_14171/g.47299 Transcript_14171/m.47299 type:complete len:201 (+) Transcript_14171:237-839(+)
MIGAGALASRGFISWCNQRVAAHPFKFASVLSGAKSTTADAVTQICFERKAEVDMRRLAVFGVFGVAYQGAFQYVMFGRVLERMFPGNSLPAVLKKVSVSTFVFDPLVFFPTFYMVREAISTARLTPGTINDAMSHYAESAVDDCMTAWSIWIPAHCVTYGLMPPHWRVPWCSVVSVGYVCILSGSRGGGVSERMLKKGR